MLIAIFAQVHLFALSGLLVIIKCYTIYSSVCMHLFVSTHLRFFVFFYWKPTFHSCSSLYQQTLSPFCHAGWMRITTSSPTEWTFRTPSLSTPQRITACLLASSSFPTARLELKSTPLPRSGRLRRTAGYADTQTHQERLDVWLSWSHLFKSS